MIERRQDTAEKENKIHDYLIANKNRKPDPDGVKNSKIPVLNYDKIGIAI